ncbi:hypothetical protein Acr_17g0006570 [Actinidia rufa]|uniref:D-mannose binding lectin protein with Apple-like carbohydrate-binding domain-containing protein n=1 Tax=Actinidia rufa TaxID=165716 RepID=A0A7J0G2S0_9ERIC|nr:hypothetical protein Acr_17g0006570 [Actinidia rufa]
MISKAYLFLPFFFHFLCIADADFPTANVSASWKNNPSNEKGSVEFYDGCTLRPILLVHNKTYPAFGMGFFRNGTSISTVNSFYLVVFMIYRDVLFDSNSDKIDESASLLVLWSANRDKPVRENATLDFKVEGELVLKDADGSLVWSTDNAYGHSVAGLEIFVGGNLMLRNRSNGVVWQSFDHPTDTWLPNQKIYNGQRITARSSWSNLSTGIYYLSMTGNGVCAFLDSNPPKEYANLTKIHESIEKGSGMDISYRETYAQFNFNYNTSGFRYIVMEPNGHLTLYQVEKLTNFFIVRPFVDILSTTTVAGDCTYPRACGRYGICLDGGGCICPVDHNENSNYFRQFQPDVGCAEITPLSCKDGPKSHKFLKLPNVTYFDFVPMLLNTTIEKCKEACLSNCSCKAALFRYKEHVSSGDCSLQSDELYSFRTTTKEDFGFYSFIKVQKMPNQIKLVKVLVPCLLVGLVATFVAAICYRYRMLKNTPDAEVEEVHLNISAAPEASLLSGPR